MTSEHRDPSWTPLHTAAQAGDLEAVRKLLADGADPNAREAGDNTTPLHWAAAAKHVEIARALLDAGADVHGIGDVHELDVIGWATVYEQPDKNPAGMASLLVERGARHHIFSAIALGDTDLIRRVVADDPKALDRRLSRFEHGQTALHFAINRTRYDILDLLIELGADLEATDWSGQTALAVALARGDHEAVSAPESGGRQAAGTDRSGDLQDRDGRTGRVDEETGRRPQRRGYRGHARLVYVDRLHRGRAI